MTYLTVHSIKTLNNDIGISFESKSQFKTYIVQNITKFHHTHYADSQQHITSAFKALPLQWSTAHHNYSLNSNPKSMHIVWNKI